MLNPAKMCTLNRKNVNGKYDKMKIQFAFNLDL